MCVSVLIKRVIRVGLAMLSILSTPLLAMDKDKEKETGIIPIERWADFQLAVLGISRPEPLPRSETPARPSGRLDSTVVSESPRSSTPSRPVTSDKFIPVISDPSNLEEYTALLTSIAQWEPSLRIQSFQKRFPKLSARYISEKLSELESVVFKEKKPLMIESKDEEDRRNAEELDDLMVALYCTIGQLRDEERLALRASFRRPPVAHDSSVDES